MARSSRIQWAVVGILIGLGCVAILFRQVGFKQSWHTLGRLSGASLVIPFAVFLVNLPLRAWRWQLIFPRNQRPRLGTCLVVLGIGNMANFLLPGRAGDLARCVLLGDGSSLRDGSRTLATLAVEKVLDGLALIGMVLFSVWVLRPPHWVMNSLRLASVIFGVTIVLLFVLRYHAQRLIHPTRQLFRALRLPFLAEKVDVLMTAFAEGLRAISSASQMLALILLTAGIWITESALIWGLAMALNLAVSLKSAVVASAILGLGLMIPAAPGGIGTYELFGTEAFKLAGLSAASALALTVVIHAWVFVANIAAGVALLVVKGISLAQLRSRLEGSGGSAIEPSS